MGRPRQVPEGTAALISDEIGAEGVVVIALYGRGECGIDTAVRQSSASWDLFDRMLEDIKRLPDRVNGLAPPREGEWVDREEYDYRVPK